MTDAADTLLKRLRRDPSQIAADLLTLAEKTLKTFEEMEDRTNRKLERLQTALESQISAECNGLASRIDAHEHNQHQEDTE